MNSWDLVAQHNQCSHQSTTSSFNSSLYSPKASLKCSCRVVGFTEHSPSVKMIEADQLLREDYLPKRSKKYCDKSMQLDEFAYLMRECIIERAGVANWLTSASLYWRVFWKQSSHTCVNIRWLTQWLTMFFSCNNIQLLKIPTKLYSQLLMTIIFPFNCSWSD